MFEGNKLQIIHDAAKAVKNQGELAVFYRIDNHIHDYGDAEYKKIRAGKAECIDPNCFSPAEMNIIKYCAEECKRQRSGEMSVYWMADAWDFAQKYSKMPGMVPDDLKEFFEPGEAKVTLAFIDHLGRLVEPTTNVNGIRKHPGDRVGISNGWKWIEKTPPDRVIPTLNGLIDAYYNSEFWNQENFDNPPAPTYWNSKSKTPQDEFYYQYEEIHPFVDGNGRTGKIIYNYLNGTLDNPIMPPNFFGGSNP